MRGGGASAPRWRPRRAGYEPKGQIAATIDAVHQTRDAMMRTFGPAGPPIVSEGYVGRSPPASARHRH